MTNIRDKSNGLKIVIASHAYIGGTFVVGSHHIARELVEFGNRVFHISTPLSPLHLFNIFEKSTKDRFSLMLKTKNKIIKNSNLINYVPFTLMPWQISLNISKDKNLMFKYMISPIRKHLNTFLNGESVDLLIIDQPFYNGLEKIINHKVLVYRPTDLYSDMTGKSYIKAVEEQLLRKVDGVIGTSAPVIKHIQSINDKVPFLLLENGVEYRHFIKETDLPIEYQNITGPKVIYMGAIDERLDFRAVTKLAEDLPMVNIIVIGPYEKQARELFGNNNNIKLLGPKSYEEIPSYLSYADIAILPLSDHPANEGRSPMKIYEYASAGLPIISKETNELKRRSEDFIYLYKNSDSISSLVGEVLSKGINKEEIKSKAKAHSWEFKVEKMMQFALNLMNKRNNT